MAGYPRLKVRPSATGARMLANNKNNNNKATPQNTDADIDTDTDTDTNTGTDTDTDTNRNRNRNKRVRMWYFMRGPTRSTVDPGETRQKGFACVCVSSTLFLSRRCLLQRQDGSRSRVSSSADRGVDFDIGHLTRSNTGYWTTLTSN